MFIGHFALALAAKRTVPTTSLGALVAAAQLVDLVWPFFLLSGLESIAIRPGITAFNPLDFVSYPFTHSLLAGFLWALLFAGAYYALTRNRRGALVIAALVVSHWLLDVVTHIPDLPLFPGDSPMLGLGLWNSVTGTLVVEGAIFSAGVVIYVRSTRAHDRIGQLALAAFLGLLVFFYLASVVAPPPGAQAVAYSALALWLFVPWAHWLDGHRRPASDPV